MQPMLGDDWLLLTAAAQDAGVTGLALIKWADSDDIARRRTPTGWRYRRDAVRDRARRYWASVRFRRAERPPWLQQERRPGSPCVAWPPLLPTPTLIRVVLFFTSRRHLPARLHESTLDPQIDSISPPPWRVAAE